MATDVKAVLKVEGEQSFAQAFENATSSVKALDSAIKLNSAAFENSSDKMASLKERSSLLRQEIDAQQRVVKLANEELARLIKEYGEGSTKVNDYQAKVNRANAKLERMTTALNENEEAMRKMGTSAESAGTKLENFGSKMTKLGSQLKWVSAGATAALTGMFTAASDLNENLNKTEVVFGELSEGMEAWSKTTLQSFGIAQSSALDMASYFGDMATSMGLTTEQAAEMGKELVGRAGDLASFKNISLDVAQNGLAAIFTGQAQSLKKFGVVMTEANLEAYALAEGFSKQYKEMSQAEQVLLRYQYVMDATKNSSGDFANTSDGAANSLRVAQESLKEAAATLGQEVIPLVLPLIQNVTELVQGINAMDEGTKNLIVTGTAIAAVASPILTIGGKMITGIGWMIKTGLPALQTAFGAASTAGTAGLAGIAASAGPLVIALGAVAAAIGLVVTEWKILDSLEASKNHSLQQQRNAAMTAGKHRISAAEVGYYDPSDVIAIGYGDGTEYYVRNGAQMTNQGRRDYYADQMEKDSVTNNYNFDVNVQSVTDLQDLLDMADSAQRLDRMGAS